VFIPFLAAVKKMRGSLYLLVKGNDRYCTFMISNVGLLLLLVCTIPFQ
jgi:hypothetical protein